MKKYIAPAIMSLCLSFEAMANSSQPERVVELFTSQGCSSCPPANEFVGEMANEPNTLVLSYGVHYWDYLGWKDTFAKPEFTKRQRAYGKTFKRSHVYTPQIILNGEEHSPKYSQGDVKASFCSETGLKIQMQKTEAGLVANAPDGADDGAYRAVLVEYVEGPQSVPVEAGENRDRVLTITNVVTDIDALGVWDFSDATSLQTDTLPETGKSYALLLHDMKTMSLKTAALYEGE